MKRFLAAIALSVSVSASAAVVDAVEYFHAGFGHYFLTAFPAEQAALDAGTTIKGWTRTGASFKVEDTSGVPVCRFFSASFAPRSSHFYTALTSECAIVKTNPAWTYEAISYYVGPVTSTGICTGGGLPVYRLYNNGMSGAPNHRYTTDTTVRSQMIAQGWIPEGFGVGIAFCTAVGAAPPADFALAQTQQMIGGTWIFTFNFGVLYNETFRFTKISAGSTPENPWYANGTNKYGQLVLAGYGNATKKMMLVSPIGKYWDVYVYDYTGPNSASGCYYFDSGVGDPFARACTLLTASRIGAAVSLDAKSSPHDEAAAKFAASFSVEPAEPDASGLAADYRALRRQAGY